MDSYSRKYEALDIIEITNLTSKQYLVYTYLISISIWNARDKEGHYYVYKNAFTVKDAAKYLKISENTWRSSIRELRKEGYIYYDCAKVKDKNGDEYDDPEFKEKKGNKYYIINFPKKNMPLDIELIKVLLSYGISIANGNGGMIVSVYAMICRYYNYCKSKPTDNHCRLSIGQIRGVFHQKRTEESGNMYRLMIALFQFLELVDVKITKKCHQGKDYDEYEFINPKLKIDPKFYQTGDGPNNIDDILEALKNEIEQ